MTAAALIAQLLGIAHLLGGASTPAALALKSAIAATIKKLILDPEVNLPIAEAAFEQIKQQFQQYDQQQT